MPVRATRGVRQPQGAGRRRSRRHLAAWAGAIVLLALVVPSVATLPFSMRWYNVQELSSAIRVAPSIAPVTSFSLYGRELEGPSPADLSGAWARVVWKVAPLAHRASSWLGHDDLGRSLLYRLLPGFLVSPAATISPNARVLWSVKSVAKWAIAVA